MKDPIDSLLQLAFFENVISTRGAYENKVLQAQVSDQPAPARDRLLRLLEEEIALHSADKHLLTIGSYLQHVKDGRSVSAKDVYSRLGITQNVFRMLERNRLSPLKIPSEAWTRFAQLFDLSVDSLIDMIRRTQQLVHYRPSFRMTLARYDVRKNREMKGSTVEQATEELYSRADLPLPKDQEKKIEAIKTSLLQRRDKTE